MEMNEKSLAWIDSQNPHFDRVYKDLYTIMKEDYAGNKEKYDMKYTKFYTTAIGQKFMEHKLDDVLFYSYASQYLATFKDYNIHLDMFDRDNYKNGQLGFECRRYDEYLYVTRVFEEERLYVGDKIVAINKPTPKYHREKIENNIFMSDIADAEDYTLLLKLAETITVEHKDGSKEVMELKNYPLTSHASNSYEETNGVQILRIEEMSDLDELLSKVHEGKKLIIDVRVCESGNEEDLWKLMGLCLDKDLCAGDLYKDEYFYTNYTNRNIDYKIDELHAFKATADEETKAIIDDLCASLDAKRGAGLVKEYDDLATCEEMIPAHKVCEKIIVLSDCYTSDEAERFIHYARKFADICVVGRESSGKYNYFNECVRIFKGEYIFTYPMSKRKECEEEGITSGIVPDVVMRFTPEECEEDCVLNKAIEM